MRSVFMMSLLLATSIGCFPELDIEPGKSVEDTGSGFEEDRPCLDGVEVGAIDPDFDNDGDGFTKSQGDCNDRDKTFNPGVDEVCDNVDNDCDGEIDVDSLNAITLYADADGDGYGVELYAMQSCEAIDGYASEAGDCDDADPLVSPNADEICDAIDNDCDGDVDEGATDATTWYADQDGDEFGDESVSILACTQPTGYVLQDTDCDDTDMALNPNADEVCDSVDNDCDEKIDDADGDVDTSTFSTYYLDSDADGFGDSAFAIQSCSPPTGYVANQTDCDDADGSINPAAAEVCADDVDNDCNPGNDATGSAWYADADADGYGDAAVSTISCSAPTGYVLDATDCNDTDAAVNPSAIEVCDSDDNDCDGTTDEADAVDAVSWFRDADSDGYGDASTSLVSCTVPSGYTADDQDCDDTDAAVNPGADEYCMTSYDDDCDGSINESSAVDVTTWYRDADSDGYGDPAVSSTGCTAPTGYVSVTGDCDDTDASVFGGASEVCDYVDNDCDGSTDEGVTTTYYRDVDGDGYGVSTTTIQDCSVPSGYAAVSGDCDDASASAYPGASEVCNSVDDDCDGGIDEGLKTTYYRDADSDGYGTSSTSSSACTAPTGYVDNNEDCDDTDADVNPDGYEIYFDVAISGSGDNNCADGLDNDCNGTADSADAQCADEDGDGIPDGVDYIFPCDPDGDGVNEAACLRADMFWVNPWDAIDCIQQEGTFTSLSLADANTLVTVTWGGETFEVCPIYPTTTGTAIDARAVSYYGADGSSTVDTSDCSDWVPADLSTYCGDWLDNLCTTYSPSDGCEATHLISIAFDGTEVTP